MSMNAVCPVFICNDIKKTLDYYSRVLGFKYASHIEHEEQFAALYRDKIEVLLVQKKRGEYRPQSDIYGNGDDMYICPDTVESVDDLYREFLDKGVTILNHPELKSYGSYEFAIQDCDGRRIGIGRLKKRADFFIDSNKE